MALQFVYPFYFLIYYNHTQSYLNVIQQAKILKVLNDTLVFICFYIYIYIILI